MSDDLEIGSYVYREDGPRGDDEGLVIALREQTAVVASEVHHDRIVYLRADLIRDSGSDPLPCGCTSLLDHEILHEVRS